MKIEKSIRFIHKLGRHTQESWRCPGKSCWPCVTKDSGICQFSICVAISEHPEQSFGLLQNPIGIIYLDHLKFKLSRIK